MGTNTLQGEQIAFVEIKAWYWLTKGVMSWDCLAFTLSVFLEGTGKAAKEPK